jgi:hypothetical protein
VNQLRAPPLSMGCIVLFRKARCAMSRTIIAIVQPLSGTLYVVWRGRPRPREGMHCHKPRGGQPPSAVRPSAARRRFGRTPTTKHACLVCARSEAHMHQTTQPGPWKRTASRGCRTTRSCRPFRGRAALQGRLSVRNVCGIVPVVASSGRIEFFLSLFKSCGQGRKNKAVSAAMDNLAQRTSS